MKHQNIWKMDQINWEAVSIRGMLEAILRGHSIPARNEIQTNKLLYLKKVLLFGQIEQQFVFSTL